MEETEATITKSESNITGDESACQPIHCLHAFDTLYCALTGAKPIPIQFKNDIYPLFVTWNTRRPGRPHRLRGCIGSFEAMPLHEGIPEFALISAFKDYRFRKISESELESLECGMSLLTDFEDAESYLDWTVGIHGIHITFPHPSTLLAPPAASSAPSPLSSSAQLVASPPRLSHKQSFSATYLPDVIPEQGWDKVEAIDSLIQKAGWSGRITEDIRRSIKLKRYQSRLADVTWEEYIQWREANE